MIKTRVVLTGDRTYLGWWAFPEVPREGDLLDLKDHSDEPTIKRYQVQGPAIFTPDRAPDLGQVTVAVKFLRFVDVFAE